MRLILFIAALLCLRACHAAPLGVGDMIAATQVNAAVAGGGVTTNFTNSASITIVDADVASPYPSSITVAGVSGSITKVTATVVTLSHTFSQDIQMILVSPGGQKAYLMMNCGSSATSVTITFDDAAGSSLPNNSSVLSSGTFKTTSYTSPTFDMTPPAPAHPYASALSTFNGGSPNGTWSLYVLDNSSGDSGNITGGWRIAITN